MEFLITDHISNQTLECHKPVMAVKYSRLDLQSLHLPLRWPSARSSVRLDRELAINFTLSMNLILYIMVFPFSYFSIATEKVMYFSVFSPRHWNYPSNCSASCLIIKW